MVIHPQSVIHSMVVCRDHSVLAQLGTPDMRVPIAYGLPSRSASSRARRRSTSPRWRRSASSRPDLQRFPGLALAWEALRGRKARTAVLNAANEVAVAAFLAGTIRFDQIHSVNAAGARGDQRRVRRLRQRRGLLELDARAARAMPRATSKGLAR